MHIKNIHSMIEKLSECAKVELDKGIEKIDTEEMSKVAEIIKELAEAEYYSSVTKAMEEHDFEDEDEIEEEGRKGYRGQPRDSKGRYMSRRGRRMGYEEPIYMNDMYPMEHYRDMDRMDGKMYYTSGSMGTNSMGSQGQSSNSSSNMSGNRGYSDGGRGNSESRYDRAKRGYEETKSMHKDNSSESKQMKMKSLEDYMKSLAEDVTDMVNDMSQEEKSLMKQKMQVLMQKIN